MRIFQIIPKYFYYVQHFEKKYDISRRSLTFEEHRKEIINDRFYAAHILKPVLIQEPDTFYTIWDYDEMQIKWAREKGMNETNLKKILFAQIEDFKPDVFYNCHPIVFDPSEIRNLGKKDLIKIAWFASPEKQFIDFSVYDTRLTNLPSEVKKRSETGYRTDLFQPAYDPEMESFAGNRNRPVDILFYGHYEPAYFSIRDEFINRLCDIRQTTGLNIRIALQHRIEYKKPPINNRVTRKIMHFFNAIEFPSKMVRKNCTPPLYGIDLYRAISESKIVFNAAVDFSGDYKVNMRNFEALGCGAHMISDEGIYPEGMVKDRDFSIYSDFDDFLKKAKYYLVNRAESEKIALQGHNMIKTTFSKDIQWNAFNRIVSQLR